ncbi:hypothetical protein BGX31_004146 [Mortierella sp. GBA43]|nr:hypothetical protein BGX31_004146 [Mortierella sp. GBA43]
MLEDLCLEHSKISDQELSQIIGKMRRVTGLSVARSHFNMESMSALRSHFLSLRRLNIADILDTADDTTSSEFAIEVLKSCPRLERLKAEGVSAEYMMDNAPWACEISLKVLEMSFNHVINDSQHEAIMGRLAKLVNLERLDVSNSWNHGDPQILIDRFSAAGVRTQKLVVDPLQDYIQNMNLE